MCIVLGMFFADIYCYFDGHMHMCRQAVCPHRILVACGESQVADLRNIFPGEERV